MIKKIELNPGIDPLLINNLKGLRGQIFVIMYACWEYTIFNCLDRIQNEISSSNTSFNQLKTGILSTFLGPQFSSLEGTNSKKWNKRKEILLSSFPNDSAELNGYIDVSSGANIKMRQLTTIKECFDFPDPIIPNPRFRGRLDELIENRNAIAHGRISSSIVGSRYTYRDLGERLEDINELCLFFIQKTETYLDSQEYLK